MRVEFSSIIVFTGLISIAVGIILATTLSTIDRSARYWIAGALLSGVAALMRTVTPQGDHLIGVSIPNAVNFLINLMFALSLRALTRNASSHRRLLVGGIVFAVLYAVLHEIFAGLGLALVEVIINPILQITMASVIGYYAMKLYKERGFRFAAVLAVLQVMLALLWIAREVTGLSQGRIDFAALSVVNAFIFTPLMLVGTVRLLCYLGLRLEEFVAKVDRSGADGLLNTLNALALSRDNETGNHVLRTQKYVRLLAEHLLARGKLDTQGIRDYPQLLHDVAPLHDIGKVGIPDRILKKPGSLDKAEWEIMRTHTTVGAEVIDAARTPQMATDSYVNDVLHLARQIALSHHENWDGSGYPQGLAGKQIPQAAQLMAIADAYDALRSERVYKKAWAHDSAVDDIVALSGKRFDPELVDAFVDAAERLREIAEAYHD
jgi:HD-GYP domain-containing protein (c-di-GMP phosphodiesterase class II)